MGAAHLIIPISFLYTFTVYTYWRIYNNTYIRMESNISV